MRKNIFFAGIVLVAIVLIVFLVRRNDHEQVLQDNTAMYSNWNAYETDTFGIYYPKDFMLLDSYRYEARGLGKEISGVAFVIPKILTEKTNLSEDTKLSVETIGGKEVCTPSDFLDAPESMGTITQNGVIVTVAREFGAAAGNRYEEIVYVYPRCHAIRYFIHSGNIQNYPVNTVQEFDYAALIGVFDQVRNSFIQI